MTSGDPIVDIAGAYFPGWVSALFVGLFTAWAVFRLTPRSADLCLRPRIVMLPAIFILSANSFWLLFFAAR